jgi:alpha-glucoside transport system permease protein
MTNLTTGAPAIGVEGGDDRKTPRFKSRAPEAEGSRAGWGTRIALAIICLVWLVPLVGLLITSFREEAAAGSSGWWTIVTNFGNFHFVGIDNYKAALDTANLGQAFINSVAIALPATFIPLLVAAVAAYAFTFMKFPFQDTLFLLVVALLVIPNYVAFVPIGRIYDALGMSGTFASVWLFHIGFSMPLAIYIMRNYMATLPRTVIESAKIDGATHFQTFLRLILPMSVPALASFAIFQFLWVWNDLFVALVFIGPGDNSPLTVAIKNALLSQQGAGWNQVTAGGFFSMIVPIIVFLSLQRFFVRGLTAGAVKG